MLGCNLAFCDIFYQDPRSIQGISFDDLTRFSFRKGKAVRFDADNIEDWLAQAKQHWRQNPFRLFEVDLTDCRWFLLSRQVASMLYMAGHKMVGMALA